MGLIYEPVTLTGRVVEAMAEGVHLELEVAGDAGSARYVLLFFGPAAEGAAKAAVGREVTVRAFVEGPFSTFMRGPVLRVLEVR